MAFATPLALALLLLSLPLVVMYLLRPRPDRVVVSSNFLWRNIAQDLEANAPWQKLRRNIFLLLQLLILTLLVLAMARPMWKTNAYINGDVVLILDTSTSMAARDVNPHRLQAAISRIEALAKSLPEGSSAALVTAGPQPSVVVGPTTDTGEIIRAARNTSLAYGENNLGDAFLLAKSIASRMRNPTIVLFTDGAYNAQSLPDMPYPVRIERVAGDGSNSGIVAMATRHSSSGVQLWISIANYGPQRTVDVSILVDGDLYDSRKIALPSDRSMGIEINDVPVGKVIEARLSPGDDLPEDDRAWTLRDPLPPMKVLLYGRESPFLQRALSLYPNVDLYKSSSKEVPAGYDLYVFNGSLPDKLPLTGNLVLMGTPGNELFGVAGQLDSLQITAQEDHPLLRYVDLTTVSIASARRMLLPDWMTPLAYSGDVPVMAVGDNAGRRVLALAFSPEDSDMPLQVSFPILVSNILDYMRPANLSNLNQSLPQGAVVPLGQDERSVRAPDGELYPVSTGVFADTYQPGVYEVLDKEGNVLRHFVVNAGSRVESNIGANASLEPTRDSAATSEQRVSANTRVRWRPLAFIALAVLFLEWALYVSRHMPRRRRIA